jgi:hypothetical protein
MDTILGRTTDDPRTEIPVVKSFNGDFSILISWNVDEAADEYYLYRAFDEQNPQYQLVYNGHSTGYRDVFTINHEETLYLYRLGKRRGKKHFTDLTTNGKAALGVVSGSRIDFQEPNDDRANATVLEKILLFANSWYYSSNTNDGIKIYDEDWYCIDVPSHWIASIILHDLDAPSQSTVQHFKIEIGGRGSETITSDFQMDIPNPNDSQERIYFRIYPDYETFEQNYPPPAPLPITGGYGKFVRYTIKISDLRPEV